ncbi:MAG TPA: ATP-dependent helicase [Acidimicrobiales bacterium]|nr:ATP-dependent helicase [Acidimicrobiales bacterium]
MTDPPPVPTPRQEYLANLGLQDILVLAPAGCGKTEALAMRARTVCERGDVRSPRKVLALTFSNKARSNLAARMRAMVGPGWRERVAVSNFHGLAARVLMAHGEQIGVNEVPFPEKAWLNRTKKELGITWRNSDDFEAALWQAKRDPVGDDEVMERLSAYGNAAAVAYEERLREEARLDYDDLIRHAARLLAIPEVRGLYQTHFGLVIVDEVQDLTLIQLGIVQAVGVDRVTYAGDPAQGIYSFAGAEPDVVFAAIRARATEIVEFDESYRSSRAVLVAVNVLARELGTTQLSRAEPYPWADDGHVILLKRDTNEEEAAALMPMLQSILDEDGEASIGIVVRRQARLQTLKDAFDAAGLSYENWSAPTHVPRVAALLKQFAREAENTPGDANEQLAALEAACLAQLDPSDVLGLDEVSAACEDLRVLTEGGLSVEEAVATCRQTPSPDDPVSPGVHVLTGHVGKGQQFDWVVVLGLEDGHVPDFHAVNSGVPAEMEEELRVLHVMVARARYGLVLTRSATSKTQYGPRRADDSRWLEMLEAVVTRSV